MEQIFWKPIHADYVCFPDCRGRFIPRQKHSGQSLKGTSSLFLRVKKTPNVQRLLDYKKIIYNKKLITVVFTFSSECV